MSHPPTSNHHQAAYGRPLSSLGAVTQYAVVKRSNGHVAFGPWPHRFMAEMALRFDTNHPNRYYIGARELVPTEWQEAM